VHHLTGRKAVVTGGSRGIGRAIVETLARHGAMVAFSGRTGADLEVAQEAFAGRELKTLGVRGDVASERDAARLVEQAAEWMGGVDVLVNNAGVGVFKPFSDMTVEEFDRMWGVNMRGVFLVTKAALPMLRASGRGDIVNIASLAGKNTFAGGTGYAATKWALRGWAGSLMLEERGNQIRVITVCPGSVDTGFSQGGKKGPTIPQPQDIADAVLFALTAPGRTMVSEIDVRPTRP
jgi:NAD(P)-dependent dehydrogenase (short-subunit alcohol dehydrogenase family)